MKSESDAYYANSKNLPIPNNNNYQVHPKNSVGHLNVPTNGQDYRNILSDKKLLAQMPETTKKQDPKA